MQLLFQFIVSIVVGLAVWGLAEVFAIPDPWPVIGGIVAFFVCMGVTFIVVDDDLF